MKVRSFFKGKIAFALIASFALIGFVFAYASTYSGNGWLKNEVKSSTKVVRDPITAYITTSGSYKTQITNITNVGNINNGSNANGGIRVFTTVYTKKSSGLFWKKKSEGYNTVSTSSTATSAIEWYNTGSLNTKIEWQNRTGNTQFYGTFTAK